MKKTFLNLLFFFLILALFISVVGCTKAEEPTRPLLCGNVLPQTSKIVVCETLEEYEAWLSDNILSDLFVTYQELSILGEFSQFKHETTYRYSESVPQYYRTYTFIDGSGQRFSLLSHKKYHKYYFKEGREVATPEILEQFDNIQRVTTIWPPSMLYISYNSIQFEYERTDEQDLDLVECKLKTIMWECTDEIHTLHIEDYPLNVTDTFLGQMLTSFEAAEAGIKALNKSMFEFSDES